ncbi:MAG: ATP-dependent Clp protease proteolytic subunit [Thermoplasmata archaeon]
MKRMVLALLFLLPIMAQADDIKKTMEIKNPNLTLSSNTGILGSKAFIRITSGLETYDAASLWSDFCFLAENGIKDVELYIHSGGGSAFAGLALADEIERAQKEGFRITAHARGIVASAAVPIVAVCNRRLATKGTIFMVHETKLFKYPGGETAKDLRSQQEMIEITRNRYIETLTRRSKLSKDKWMIMEDRITWFSAEQALEWGLIDEIE